MFDYDRERIIAFTCKRCGAISHISENSQPEAEGNIQCYRPPAGWEELSLPYSGQLCPECSKQWNLLTNAFFENIKFSILWGEDLNGK